MHPLNLAPPSPDAALRADGPDGDAATSVRDAETPRRPYPAPAPAPTQLGPGGVRYDFNEGARVVLPAREEGAWRVILRDLETGNILFQTTNKGALVRSSKRYFVRFLIEVQEITAEGEVMPCLSHAFDAADREVLLQFPLGTLGDTLAWFSYAERFAQKHRCRLICAMSDEVIPLLKDAYPALEFVTHDEAVRTKIAERVYATYNLGLFFDDAQNIHQPTDFRHVGLHRTAAYILGVDPQEAPPRLALKDEGPPISEPYVVIAVQASTQCKMWNNPLGWREVIAHLKHLGYRVVCIDKKPVTGSGMVYTHLPHGVDDETGDRPLTERARWLSHAKAFIGLSSGLTWLAWAAGTPVVMISGFTHPTNEFETPGRVINWHACNSCWNDVRHTFDHKDFLWCPRHAGTPRQFECTKLITAAHVIRTLDALPGFKPHPAGGESPSSEPAEVES